MEQTDKLLKDYSDQERGAYLGAIASLATADRIASPEELEYIEALATSAELSDGQKIAVRRAATEMSDEDLKHCLDVLKGSELRFSLITDLISFGESDQNYTPEERASVEKIAQYLNINPEQFSVLNKFVEKTASSGASPEQMQDPAFLGSMGMNNDFQRAGINMGSMTKGLLGIVGPMLLAGLISRGMGGRRGMGGGMLGGGMLGGGLGGMLGGGGLGGMLGGGMGGSRMGGGMMGGGLGSLIGMLNGGRGMRSTGGLLGRVLRGF